MNAYVAAILPVLGVVFGAVLHFWFSRNSADWSRFQDKRVQAYVDFLKAVAGISQAQRFKDKKAEQESAALLADARARIAVFGHSDVLAALAAFDRTDKMLTSPNACQAFTELVRTVRRVSNVEVAPLNRDELFLALFGNAPNHAQV